MSEENKALMRSFYEGLFDKKDLGVLDRTLTSDFVDHNPSPGQAPGVEGAKQLLGMYLAAFPDLHVHLDWQVAEGDMVVSRMTMHGTNQGDFAGMAATGKEVKFTVTDSARITGGKIAERWGDEDQLGMMVQLGIIPMPG